jgi:hypothetical protein
VSDILIQCPQTLQKVSVGLETDYRTFYSLPNIPSPMHCPACGAVHVWSTESATLSDDDPQSRLLELPITRQSFFRNLSKRRPERRWAA